MRAIGRSKFAGSMWRKAMWAIIAMILLCPIVAMQLTSQIQWDRVDFAAAAILLAGVGGAVEIAGRLTTGSQSHLLVSVAVILAGATIWADAAVGIF